MHTTIQIKKETLKRLQAQKVSNRSSYDEVLNRMLDEVEDETLSMSEIEDVQHSLEDLKKGRTRKIDDVARDFGIKLR